MGDVVTRVREALMETTALLDEIVVVDSDSTDDTYAAATDAGAVVHRSREIRPDLGTHRGKGEAMWKSMFVTTGDLVVFMDADLLDWDTHFVRGLLGPLLTDPGVALVKGFYERPLADLAGWRRLTRGRAGDRAARAPVDRARMARAGLAGAAAGGGVGRTTRPVRAALGPHRVRRGARRPDRHGPPPRTRSHRPGRPRPTRPPPPGTPRPRQHGRPDPRRLQPPVERRGPRSRRTRPTPQGRPRRSRRIHNEVPLLERPPVADVR